MLTKMSKGYQITIPAEIRKKFDESLSELRKIGWFSSAVIDKIMMEG